MLLCCFFGSYAAIYFWEIDSRSNKLNGELVGVMTVSTIPEVKEVIEFSDHLTAEIFTQREGIGGYQEEYIFSSFKPQHYSQYMKYVSNTPIQMGTIFVMIAHFRDDWCDRTITELFKKCRNCERIFVGVAEQLLIPSSDVICGSSLPVGYRQRVRIIHMNHTEAKGPTFARYLTSHLWRGEEYFLQIDAHMHFIEDWDEKLLTFPVSIPQQSYIDSTRVVFSTYPPVSLYQVCLFLVLFLAFFLGI